MHDCTLQGVKILALTAHCFKLKINLMASFKTLRFFGMQGSFLNMKCSYKNNVLLLCNLFLTVSHLESNFIKLFRC